MTKRIVHPADSGRFDFSVDALAAVDLDDQIEGMIRLHTESIRAYNDRLGDTEMRDKLGATRAHWTTYQERQERRVAMHEALLQVAKAARAELRRRQPKRPFSYHDIRLGRVYFGRKVVAIGACILPDAVGIGDNAQQHKAGLVRIRYMTDDGPKTWPALTISGAYMYECSARWFADWVRAQMKKESA